MGLQEKYKAIVEAAKAGGVEDLQLSENDNVLSIKGSASQLVKDKMWSIYESIDPDMRAGDLVMDIEISESEESYTIKSGDSLSKIASHYHTTWQKIFEANKDTIKNPDLIFPGQKIRIPK